jgi:hypothetical protein
MPRILRPPLMMSMTLMFGANRCGVRYRTPRIARNDLSGRSGPNAASCRDACFFAHCRSKSPRFSFAENAGTPYQKVAARPRHPPAARPQSRSDRDRRHAAGDHDENGIHMSDCIHCDIHDMLDEHLQKEGADLAEIAAKVTEVLADLVLMANPPERAALIADVIANLGGFVLEKSAEDPDDPGPRRSRH